jgi:hypothetical protein
MKHTLFCMLFLWLALTIPNEAKSSDQFDDPDADRNVVSLTLYIFMPYYEVIEHVVLYLTFSYNSTVAPYCLNERHEGKGRYITGVL